MTFNPKSLVSNYFKKKKPLSIFFDALFVLILILLLIPGTRKETAAFFIRWTSFPASSLDEDEQYMISAETRGWQLFDLNGNTYNFEDLNDKPVFLNVWATWCPPCIAELPGIQDLHGEFGNEVNFILISNEDPGIISRFIEKNGYTDLPLYYASYTPADFSSQSIPATFIVSNEGKVMVKKKGAAKWNSDKTKRLFEQLIKE
jgi:thiol-disulfide isomerase/thioredoxin